MGLVGCASSIDDADWPSGFGCCTEFTEGLGGMASGFRENTVGPAWLIMSGRAGDPIGAGQPLLATLGDRTLDRDFGGRLNVEEKDPPACEGVDGLEVLSKARRRALAAQGRSPAMLAGFQSMMAMVLAGSVRSQAS